MQQRQPCDRRVLQLLQPRVLCVLALAVGLRSGATLPDFADAGSSSSHGGGGGGGGDVGAPPPRRNDDDVVLVPWLSQPTPALVTRNFTGVVPSTGRSYSVYVAYQQDASRLSIELPPNGCAHRRTVSDAAALFGCEFATNAGYFLFNGSCHFNLIVNSSTVVSVVLRLHEVNCLCARNGCGA
jgi:hypothetical protein